MFTALFDGNFTKNFFGGDRDGSALNIIQKVARVLDGEINPGEAKARKEQTNPHEEGGFRKDERRSKANDHEVCFLLPLTTKITQLYFL